MKQEFIIPNRVDLKDFDSYKKSSGVLCVMVESVEEKKSAKGNYYAKVSIEDKTGYLDFFLFGEDYVNWSKYIHKGVRLYIEFKKVDDFFNKGEKTIKIIDIDLMKNWGRYAKVLITDYTKEDKVKIKSFANTYGVESVYQFQK